MNRSRHLNRRDTVGLIAAAVLADAVIADPLHAAAALGAANPDSAKLTADHFEQLVGQPFTVGDNRVRLRSVQRGHYTQARFRQQFAVMFDAPPSPAFESRMLPVSHAALGRHDLLVSSVGSTEATSLEICFG